MANMQSTLTPRTMAENQFKNSRNNLLLMVILTVVNLVMLYLGSESMLLFSASIPYYAVAFGIWGNSFEMFVFGLVLAVVLIVVYFLCWLLSKKRPGWLVVALVLFILDTLALAGLYLMAGEVSGVLDIVFHASVLYYLIIGIVANNRLKKLPPEDPIVPEEPVEAEGATVNSVPLRRIGEDEKCRILLEYTYGTHRIVYRRVKRTNQIVINNYIYGELEMLAEPAHSLSARVDGHEFVVGYDGVSSSYLLVDGVQVAKKLRLF